MNARVHRGSTRSSVGEVAGAIVVAVALVALIMSALVYGAGDDIAFIPLLTAFVLGVSGIGIHVAAREGRLRREGR